MVKSNHFRKLKLLTSPERSRLMKQIKSRNTLPELLLRKSLWALNIRYRIHVKQFPGCPDILIKKYKLAIFVDGSFWHGFNWQEKKIRIKSNRDFWINKIERNMNRDLDVNNALDDLGYVVMRFWDHDIVKELDRCLNQITLYLELFQKNDH